MIYGGYEGVLYRPVDYLGMNCFLNVRAIRSFAVGCI